MKIFINNKSIDGEVESFEITHTIKPEFEGDYLMLKINDLDAEIKARKKDWFYINFKILEVCSKDNLFVTYEHSGIIISAEYEINLEQEKVINIKSDNYSSRKLEELYV